MTEREEYILLAMRADKRLQRLEKYAQREGYETLLKGAYSRAMRDIRAWRGEGHKRFGTRPPSDPYELRAMLNDLKTFLRADTSTLKPGKGTRGYSVESYEKMAKTFNNEFDSDLTWQQIGDYYDSKKAEKIAKTNKASSSVARALGEFKKLYDKNPKLTNAQLMRDIKANPNIKLSNNDTLNDVMIDMAKKGFSPWKTFKD